MIPHILTALIILAICCIPLGIVALFAYDRRNSHRVAKDMARKFGANVTPVNSPEAQRIIKGVDLG